MTIAQYTELSRRIDELKSKLDSLLSLQAEKAPDVPRRGPGRPPKVHGRPVDESRKAIL